MNYLAQRDYEDRATRVRLLLAIHGRKLHALSSFQVEYLRRYYVDACDAGDTVRYRRNQVKLHPNIELQANQAFERMLAELGVPETLPSDPMTSATSV